MSACLPENCRGERDFLALIQIRRLKFSHHLVSVDKRTSSIIPQFSYMFIFMLRYLWMCHPCFDQILKY